jgi:SAM-dependent methyltransferase
MSVTPVPLSEISSHPPGALVLERCFGPKLAARDRSVVDAEYKADKYRTALDFAVGKPTRDPFAVRMFEFGHDADADWCFSRGNELFRSPLAEIQTVFDDFLVSKVLPAAAGSRTIIETGCGYGYNLDLLARAERSHAYAGGDFASTAVELAQHLFGKAGPPRVEEFDYYSNDYGLLAKAEGPVTVFTCHSIEQLPTAVPFLDALASHKKKIAGVVHLEPIFEVHGESLLGRLRRAHAEALDYNRDLLSLLKGRADIVVHRVEPNVLGLNPLNPTSVIHWSFR